ncbi:ABC transporter permease [Polymorphospora lycopeni]|uniref:ABC transporter permease n=1 Tax=Polymorphospora lycopeni TaxID=3140240 RepID=A0ABV5CNT5_9ACTN
MTLVNELKDRFGVEPVLRVLKIAPSTYYGWLARQAAPGPREIEDRRAGLAGLGQHDRAVHGRVRPDRPHQAPQAEPDPPRYTSGRAGPGQQGVHRADGLLGFGVALSWLVGREFTDGTITGLFALPVSRRVLVLAKLLSHLLWAVLVAIVLTAVVAVAGTLLGLGAWNGDVVAALGRQFVLTVLSALVAAPAGWAATLGRGPLPGIATTICLIVVAQVAVVAGPGAWLPVAAPALWALQPGTVAPAQLALVAAVPVGFAALTVTAWSRLQLDR